MAEAGRAEWLRVLEAAAARRPDQCNAEWEWLMRNLGLGLEYFLAVYEAVLQGRWRLAEDPKTYIKTAAKREARKMGLVSGRRDGLVLAGGAGAGGEEATAEEKLEFINYQRDKIEPSKGADGVWRAGPGLNREYNNPRRDYRAFLRSELPDELAEMEQPTQELEKAVARTNASTDEFHIHLKPVKKAAWKKWADAAGFDKWERKVLRYKRNKVSREKALARERDERSRRELQAAWKRFDRNGLQRLMAVKKKFGKNVPEQGLGDTR